MGIAGNRNTFPMFEGLFKTNDAEELQPWLAKSWETSPDGKTITITVFDGIKFQDGTDFDADAVKYNLESVYNANLMGTAFMENVESYTVLDKYNIQITLKEVDSLFLLRLVGIVGMMASPTALQLPTTPETVAQVHSVGTGPFLFDSWERDTFVKYKKWDGYRDPTIPYLDNIMISNTADITVSIMALMAGETDAVENVDPVDAIRLGDMGYDIWQPSLYYLHSICPAGNDPNSPFHDKRVRLALEYAIDKRTIAAGVGMGFYEPLNQLATPMYSWYNPDLPYREYDPQKARDLLKEAGYENGFTTKLITDVMARRDTLVAVQTYLEEVGIKTEMEILDFGAAFTMPRTGWEGIYFPGFPNVGTLLGILGRYGDETTFVSMYQPEGWWDLWDSLVKELDSAKRIEILKDILKLAYDEVVYIPYQGDAPLVAINPNLHGFEHHANHMVSFWDPGHCWLSED
jgi:ABC-type transport system substrate-binding protein